MSGLYESEPSVSSSVAGSFLSPTEVPKLHSRVVESFRSHKTQSLEFRLDQLRKLYYAMEDNLEELVAALVSDLHKPMEESMMTEIGLAMNEILDTMKNLKSWAKDERRSSDLIWAAMKPTVRKEPYGTILIIATWNYPVFLSLPPLVGAIAAGNTAILKMSEISSATARVIAKIVNENLDNDSYYVINGEAPVTTALLDQKFDFIFFTGSSRIGKLVSLAAAKTLTPTVLELGGKSPAFVLDDSNLKLAAVRLAYGAFTNSGQTCVAPDYILLQRGLEVKFVKYLKDALETFYPEGINKNTKDYAHIINDGNFDRIYNMAKESKGTVVIGGLETADRASHFIAPTVILDVKPSDSTMQDEIFGPLLPIMLIDSVDEAIEYVNNVHDTPLSLYIFTKNRDLQRKILTYTRSGGAMVNGCMVHVGITYVPFGGVGQSGHGRYHGKDSFDTFSHHRTLVTEPYWTEALTNVRYPPYTSSKIAVFKAFVMRKPWFGRQGPVSTSMISRVLGSVNKWYVAFLVVAVASVVTSKFGRHRWITFDKSALTNVISRFH